MTGPQTSWTGGGAGWGVPLSHKRQRDKGPEAFLRSHCASLLFCVALYQYVYWNSSISHQKRPVPQPVPRQQTTHTPILLAHARDATMLTALSKMASPGQCSFLCGTR